jgi:hypothetical protein
VPRSCAYKATPAKSPANPNLIFIDVLTRVVAKVRLPAACRARGLSLGKINDLLSETDRADLIEAYRDWSPNLIFIDVFTRVVVADINAPETGMRVMQAVYAQPIPE